MRRKDILYFNWLFRRLLNLSGVTRIGVLSDTHIHNLKDVPVALLESLKKCDVVIHLGDFVSMELLEYFKRFPNFYGIAGNHDTPEVQKQLRRADVIEVNGKRLGLLHGYWCPLLCGHRSRFRFRKEKLDAIIYGHTHMIRNEMKNNLLWFNPGSASAMWPAPWKTFGVLNVGDAIRGEIVAFAPSDNGKFSKYVDSMVDRPTVLKWVCGSPRLPDYSID
jgi:uncharacterized protein